MNVVNMIYSQQMWTEKDVKNLLQPYNIWTMGFYYAIVYYSIVRIALVCMEDCAAHQSIRAEREKTTQRSLSHM